MMLANLPCLAPIVRDLRAGLERRYRVEVARDGGDRFSYRLRIKVTKTKVPKGSTAEPRLDVRLTDYRSVVGGHTIKMGLAGGGLMPVEPSGLPGGFSIAGPQGPTWLPLLSLYVPGGEEDGEFPVLPVEVGGGLKFSGKGTRAKERFDVAAEMTREGKSLGTLTFGASLDRQGWPTKADGTLVSADGTTRFTLERG